MIGNIFFCFVSDRGAKGQTDADQLERRTRLDCHWRRQWWVSACIWVLNTESKGLEGRDAEGLGFGRRKIVEESESTERATESSGDEPSA